MVNEASVFEPSRFDCNIEKKKKKKNVGAKMQKRMDLDCVSQVS